VATNATLVLVPHTTHENTCGRVVPAKIDRKYGTKAMKVSAMAAALSQAWGERLGMRRV
jgi:hypothetical protein